MAEKLFIVRPSLAGGGADRVTLTLLRHLPADLFRTSLVLMRNEGELLPQLPTSVPVHDLGSRRLWTAWWPLFRLVRKERPDILFSTSSGANVVAAIAHLLAGRRGRLVLSERCALGTGPSWKKQVLSRLKRLLYPFADRITAVSEGVKSDLVSKLHLEEGRVSVVYNPVVEKRLEELVNEPVDQPWFGDDLPVILTAGRLVAAKDHETLLRAFANTRASHQARLVILGEGPQRSALEDLAKGLGVSDSVFMPGFDPNPFKYMAQCTLFVLSSRFEGLPGTLIQAMACGAPVISTACPHGPSEILEAPGSGMLVPVGDSARLGEEMARLLGDPEIRRRMSRAGRTAAQRFSVEAVLGNYIRALQ